jgi:hypothetical protein
VLLVTAASKINFSMEIPVIAVTFHVELVKDLALQIAMIALTINCNLQLFLVV